MEMMSAMKNTDYSGKHFNKELLNVWLVRGAKSILTAGAVWTVAFVTGIYNDVQDLQANERVQEIKIESVKNKQKNISDKVDDLHWYLIRRKDVKIDKEDKKK